MATESLNLQLTTESPVKDSPQMIEHDYDDETTTQVSHKQFQTSSCTFYVILSVLFHTITADSGILWDSLGISTVSVLAMLCNSLRLKNYTACVNEFNV